MIRVERKRCWDKEEESKESPRGKKQQNKSTALTDRTECFFSFSFRRASSISLLASLGKHIKHPPSTLHFTIGRTYIHIYPRFNPINCTKKRPIGTASYITSAIIPLQEAAATATAANDRSSSASSFTTAPGAG